MDRPANTASVDAAFEAVAERRQAEADFDKANGAMWRTHHWPERYERCLTIRGKHYCRRCTWFYAIAFSVLLLGLFGASPWPTAWDVPLVWLLSIPATIEFVGGELGFWRYDSRRQVAVTALLAPAVGRGMLAEVADQGSWLWWGPCLVFGSTWLIAGIVGRLRRTGQYA